MSLQEITPAWTDEDYRPSLDKAMVAQLPAHPAGFIELDDEEMVVPNDNPTTVPRRLSRDGRSADMAGIRLYQGRGTMALRLLCASTLLSILAVFFTGLASPPALAQDQLAPGDVACDVEPVSIDHLITIWFETSRRLPVYAPYAVDATVPIGPLADAETAAAVQLTIARVYACLAAGDYLCFFAMLTDDFASELGPPHGATPEEVTAYLTSAPVRNEDAPTLVAVTNVMVIDDHRIGAFVIDRFGQIGSTSYVTLVQAGERWLLDSVKYFVK